MRKYINLIIIILAIPLCANTCTSCKKEARPSYYLNEDFKNYIVFPKGSYWIYEEKNTSSIDSIYIFKQGLGIVSQERATSFDYEAIIYNIYSSYNKDTLYSTGSAIRAGSQDGKKINDYTEISKNLLQSFKSNYQFFDGDTLLINLGYIHEPVQGSKVLYKNSIPSYNVNGKDYKQVKVFENLIKNYDTQPQIIYYAKNVGVIKKELFNGEVWELKKYFINK